MPKIIFVSDLTVWSMGKGSGGPAFSQTLKKYIDENWDVYLISDELSNKDCAYLDKTHNIIIKPSKLKKYVSVKKVGVFFKWLDHIYITKKFCKEIKKLLAEGNKNVILYAYEIFGVKACKKMSKKYRIPLVTRFQGTILSQFQNNWINHIRLYPHFQALSQKADLIIMTDDGTKGRDVLKSLKNKSHTLFFRNGLDLLEKDINQMYETFDKKNFLSKISIKVTNNDCIFLTVSRLTGWKKVERAIDGFAEYCNQGSQGKMLIVGDGDQKDFLMQRAGKLGVLKNIYFAGSVSHENVYQFMMACDVFLSLYDLSNVGNPLLEAMTLGKSIITLDVGDTRKLIKNEENGILLTYDELPNLWKKMAELAQSKERRKKLGKAAEEYAKNNFYTWNKRMQLEFLEVGKLIENY